MTWVLLGSTCDFLPVFVRRGTRPQFRVQIVPCAPIYVSDRACLR
jgi:hypothetical protein